jgi:hypothetical protein
MPKVVCVKCEIAFRVKKNGVILAVTFNNGKLYELYSADLWQCPKCGFEVVAGIAHDPFANHYNDKIDVILNDARNRGCYIVYEMEK